MTPNSAREETPKDISETDSSQNTTKHDKTPIITNISWHMLYL